VTLDIFRTPASVGQRSDFDRDEQGQLTELGERQQEGWSALVSAWMDRAVAGGSGLFYNPLARPSLPDAVNASVTWDAFPRVMENRFRGKEKWQRAETLQPFTDALFRTDEFSPIFAVDENGSVITDEPLPLFFRPQDEYCEWHTYKEDGVITRIAFTAEGPEYWRFLAEGTRGFFAQDDPRGAIVGGDAAKLVELYRRLVSPEVQEEDLYWQHDTAIFSSTERGFFFYRMKGDYNPLNKWNTTHGVVHLTHPANTLQAEVNLGADATVLRHDANGILVTNSDKLICCSGYGGVNRSSDPAIGGAVNGLARDGLTVTLADPVGLYISELDTSGFAGPNGEDVSLSWQVRRGVADDGNILSAVFEPPVGLGIEQMSIGGVDIEFAGQIADKISMKLTGEASAFTDAPVESRPCEAKCCTLKANPKIKRLVSDPAQVCALLKPGDTQFGDWVESFEDAAGGAVPGGAAPAEARRAEMTRTAVDRLDETRRR